MVRILIDTNIIISREDIQKVPDNVQELLRILNETDHKIVIHPLSLDEIEKDKNTERREIVLSKLRTYSTIESPPSAEDDPMFSSLAGRTENAHDMVDNNLLYCVYKNAVHFLITEDEKIHKKALKLNIADRVFRVSEALEYFKNQMEKNIPHPPPLKPVPVHNLDLNDSIFNSLKEDYREFENWWKKIAQEGRKAWVHYVNDKIGAILILKEEEEAIDSNPPLPKKRRLKICTLVVDPIDWGSKIGELFIKISVQTAVEKKIDEIYLTHFTKPNDFLVSLIEEFGFYHEVKKNNGEDVFIKKLMPEKYSAQGYSPQEIYKRFYPSFYDGDSVNKFIVPIKPEWHNRLFTESKGRQLLLSEITGKFIVEGNTIKKAYLCHSKIKGMKEGDILLFYRSGDPRGITSIGIVERVYDNLTDSNEIISLVGKRTVYSPSEIEKMARKPVKLIFFWWVMHLKEPLKYNHLLDNGILNGPPQTITRISQDKYLKIKEVAKIDVRYTFN